MIARGHETSNVNRRILRLKNPARSADQNTPQSTIGRMADTPMPLAGNQTQVDLVARRGKPARFFCVTVQVPGPGYDSETAAKNGFDILTSFPKLKFLAGQVEKAPTTGQQHWQLYVSFKSPARPSVFRSDPVWNNPHVEYRRGSDAQAFDYVTKEETRLYGPFVFGERPAGQGKRTDLDEIAEMVLDKSVPMTEVLSHRPKMSLLFHDKMMKLRCSILPERDMESPPHVFVYWGDSGTGKTKAVYDYAKDNGYRVFKKCPGKWWDGYQQQEVVLIDDFNTKFFGHTQKEDMSFLLQLLDRYPVTVEYKGGTVPFNSPTIFITSNYDPTDWFPEVFEGCPEQRFALRRRFTEVKKFSRAATLFFGHPTAMDV